MREAATRLHPARRRQGGLRFAYIPPQAAPARPFRLSVVRSATIQLEPVSEMGVSGVGVVFHCVPLDSRLRGNDDDEFNRHSREGGNPVSFELAQSPRSLSAKHDHKIAPRNPQLQPARSGSVLPAGGCKRNAGRPAEGEPGEVLQHFTQAHVCACCRPLVRGLPHPAARQPGGVSQLQRSGSS